MFSDPLPPAFYPVGLNLEGRICIVIGRADDREAQEKFEALHEVGADVRWLTDIEAVTDEDVHGAFFVIVTPYDDALSARMRHLADIHHFLLCCIDQPRHGFVAMQAVVKSGPARIAISTGGVAPAVGKKLRIALQAALDGTFERFLGCLRIQRRRNRVMGREERRKVMLEATDEFTVDVSVTYPRWFEAELEGMLPSIEHPKRADG